MEKTQRTTLSTDQRTALPAANLLALSRNIAAVKKLEDFLPAIVNELRPLFEFKAASLMVWSKQLTAIDFWQTFHESPSGKFFSQKEIFLADYLNDPLNEIKGYTSPRQISRTYWQENYHEESALFTEETEFRYTFYIPLMSDGSPIGLLQFRSDDAVDELPISGTDSEYIQSILVAILHFLLREKKGYKDNSVQANTDLKLAAARTVQQLQSLLTDKIQKLIPFHDLIITLEEQGQEKIFISTASKTPSDSGHSDPLAETVSFRSELFQELLLARMPRVIDLENYLLTGPGPEIFEPGEGIKELMGTALVHHDKPIGVLYLASEKRGFFSSFDPKALKNLADQLAVAVFNVSLNDELMESARKKSTLLAINNELAQINNRHDLIQCLHKHLNKQFRFDHSMISLCPNQQGSYFMFCDALSKYNLQSEPGILATNEFVLNDHIKEMLFSGRDPVIIDLDQLTTQGENAGWLVRSYNYGLKEMTILRLGDLNNYQGSLIIFSKIKKNFGPAQLSFLNRIVRQFSFTLNNITLIEDLLEKEKEKALLFNLSNEITAIRSKPQLQAFLDEKIKPLFPMLGFILFSLNPERTTLTPVIWDTGFRRRKQKPNTGISSKPIPINNDLTEKILLSENPQIWNSGSLLSYFDFSGQFIEGLEEEPKEVVISALMRQGKTNGMMMIVTDIFGAFTAGRLLLIKGISGLLGPAIDNLMASEEAQRRESEKTFLLSFCHATATVRDQEELFGVIQQGLKDFFNIEEYLLTIKGIGSSPQDYYSLDFKSGRSQLHHFRAGAIDDKKVTVDENLFNMVFSATGQTCLNRDEMTDTERSFLAGSIFDEQESTGSLCGITLRTVNQKIGILWTTQKIVNNQLFESVSAQIATAFANVLASVSIDRKFSEINAHKRQLEEENLYLQEEIQTTNNYNEVVGNSLAMRKVYKMLSQVAETASSVLILGETGTGKELVARAIHNNSLRKDKIMIKVNCAALPANLIESELFGHEKGSFTGAIERKIGKFELANKGTLFLDEIGELPADLQVKILRALQEKEIERVGGRSVIKTDVRIIAATNRDLLREVQLGNFRSDLYFRLNVFPILLPPLRDRREDIPLLAEHFLDKHSKKGSKGKMNFSSRVLKQLSAYEWPGNVRELEHLIERSILLTSTNTIEQVHLPSADKEYADRITPDAQVKTIDEVEREHIILILKKCNGKIAGIGGAAELLKIPSTTLNSKIRKLGIKKGLTARK